MSAAFIGMKELFKFYPYKNYEESRTNDNTTRLPYVPIKERRPAHSNALLFGEWREIIECYVEVFKQSLLDGCKIYLPHRLGSVFMTKHKSLKVDQIASKAQKKTIFHKNSHTNGYVANVDWNKKTCALETKEMWRMKPNRIFAKQMSQTYLNNPSAINKLVDKQKTKKIHKQQLL